MAEASEQTSKELADKTVNVVEKGGVKIAEEMFNTFDVIDASKLSEGSRMMYYDAKDLDETVDIAKEDLLDTEKEIDKLEADIESLTETLDGLENAKGPIFKDSAEPKLEDLVSDRTKEAFECIKLDLNTTKDSLKSAKDAAKEAWKQYVQARNTYIKTLTSEAGDAVIYFAHASLEKSASIFKNAVKGLNEIKDALLNKSREAIKSMTTAVMGAVDFATGGLITKESLNNIEIAKNSKGQELGGDPSKNIAIMSAQFEDMCMKMMGLKDKNKKGVDYDALKDFYQNIHDANWGEKGLSPIEKGEEAVKKFIEHPEEIVSKVADKITDAAEKTAVRAHDAALSVYAGSLGIAADLYSSQEKFSSWKGRAYNHVKASLEQGNRNMQKTRAGAFDKIDVYNSIEKTKTSEYKNKNKDYIETLEGLPLAENDPIIKTYITALKGGGTIGEKVHYAVGDAVHALSYTGKKVAGFAPNLVRATEGDLLNAAIQKNLKTIEKIDKRIEAEDKVRESFKNTKEKLLGKADEIKAMKIGAKAPDKSENIPMETDQDEERD